MLTFNAKVEAVIGSDYFNKVYPVIQSATQKIDIVMYEWNGIPTNLPVAFKD